MLRYGINLVKQKLLFVIIGLLTISSLHTTYKLLTREVGLEEAQTRLAEAKREQQELEARRQEVGSLDYIEREARDKLGVVKEGEVVVVLPSEDVLRKFAPKINEAEMKEEEISVWRQWLRLFVPELEKVLSG